MTEKKKLANHNPYFIDPDDPEATDDLDHLAQKGNFFTDEKIQKLRKDYGFRDEYRLDLYLENAAVVFLGNNEDMSGENIGDIRLLIESLSKGAKLLRDALKYTGMPEREFLLNHIDPIVLNDCQGHRFLSKLHVLHTAAKKTLEVEKSLKAKPKPGPKENPAKKILINHLQDIYTDGTGKIEIYTHVSGVYKNPCILFIENCLPTIGVKMANSTIGDIVKKLSGGKNPRKKR